MRRTVKPVAWLGGSLRDLRGFPELARTEAGFQLFQVQIGEAPDDWKPMASVGQGVCEIRVKTGRAHRVFYVARFSEAVYVLHAFEKKSQKTSKQDVEIGRSRYRDLVSARSRRQEKP